MLDHIGERLLGHPVRRQVEPGEQVARLAAHVQRHLDPGRGNRFGQRGQIGERVGGFEVGGHVVLHPQHAEQGAHLSERAPADLLDRGERPGGLGGL